MNRLSSRNGFSLIALLVVATVMSIVMFGSLKMVSYMGKAQNRLKTEADLDDRRILIQKVLRDDNHCETLMKGTRFSYNQIDETAADVNNLILKNPRIASFTLAEVGLNVSSGLNMSDVSLVNFKLFDAPSSFFTAELRLRAVQDAREITRYVPLTVVASDLGDGVREIVSCSSVNERTPAASSSPMPSPPPGVVTAPLEDSFDENGVREECEPTSDDVLRRSLMRPPLGLLLVRAIPPKYVYSALAQCPSGQKAIAGGGECGAGFSKGVFRRRRFRRTDSEVPGSMIASSPTDDGTGWQVACCIEGRLTDDRPSAYAYCQ